MKNFSILVLVLAMASSCAPKNSRGKSPFILGDMFSNRQQSSTLYVGLIQLQLPALLAEAQMVDGKAVIDDAAKAAVLAEQEEVIKALKKNKNVKIFGENKADNLTQMTAFRAVNNLKDSN